MSVKSRHMRKSKLRKSRKLNKSKCKGYLKDKIKINMDEYKSGRFKSPKQAIAVSYSQVIRKHPHCARHLRKSKIRKSRRR